MLLEIHEPWTVVTDVALGIISLFFGRILVRRSDRFSAGFFWGCLMFALTMTSFMGAATHALDPSHPWGKVLWIATLIFLHFVAFFLQLALLAHLDLKWGTGWQLLTGAKLLVFLYLAFAKRDFMFGVVDYSIPMLTYLVVSLWQRRTSLALGISLSVVAAIIQQAKIGISDSFNHNDVYHVVQAVALFFIYRGALMLPGAVKFY